MKYQFKILVFLSCFFSIASFAQDESVEMCGQYGLEYLASSSDGDLYYNGEAIVCTDSSVYLIPNTIGPIYYENDSLSVYLGLLKYRFHANEYKSIKQILHLSHNQNEVISNTYNSTAGGNSISFELDIPVDSSNTDKNIRNWLSETIFYKLSENRDNDNRPMFLLDMSKPLSGEYMCDYYAREYLQTLYPLFTFQQNYVERQGNSYCFSFSKQLESQNYVTYFFSITTEGGWIHPLPNEWYITFRKNDGQILSKHDIFKPETDNAIKEIVIEELRNIYNDRFGENISLDDYKDNLAALSVGLIGTVRRTEGIEIENQEKDSFDINVFNLPEPALLSDGVVFCFQPYEVGSFNEGFYMVYLPYSRIENMIKIEPNHLSRIPFAKNDKFASSNIDVGTLNCATELERLKSEENRCGDIKRRVMLLHEMSRCANKLHHYDEAFDYCLSIHEIIDNSNCLYYTILLDLAYYAACKSDIEKYKEYTQKALDFCRDRYGQISRIFVNVADYQIEMTSSLLDNKRLIEELSNILTIKEQLYSSNDLRLIPTLELLSDAYLKEKEYESSDDLRYRIQKIRDTQNLIDDPSKEINNNMEIQSQIIARAKQYMYRDEYEKAYDAMKELDDYPYLMTNDIDYIEAEALKTFILEGMGNLGKTQSMALEVSTRIHDYIIRRFQNSISAKRTEIWSSVNNWFYDFMPSLCVKINTPEIAIQTYNDILLSKGILLNADKTIKEIIKECGDLYILSLYDEYALLSEQLRTPKYLSMMSNSQIDSLSVERDNMEQELLIRSKDFRNFTDNLKIDWDKVREKMNDDDVAIEFSSYEWKANRRYVAFSIKKSYDAPHVIPLFDEAYINDKMNEGGFEEVSHKIWSVLVEELKGVNNIYFSPAGLLYNIPIEHFPNSLDNINRKFYRLSSTREIAMKRDSIMSDGIVLYGGLNYDKVKYNIDVKGNNRNKRSLEKNDRDVVERLSYLKGSIKEVKAIYRIVKMKETSSNVSLYKGKYGTEESFKELSGQRNKIIHIATHGFYDSQQSMSYIEDDMLENSGLYFSVAHTSYVSQSPGYGHEDGKLTAREISSLDLRGLNLVSLSACETALGDISGEGVFGLQRGFKKAGAESILMSLWKVDDEATCLLMTEFYQNWISDNMSKYVALENAKQTVRSHKEKGWDDPKYWAAFILLDGLD